MLPHLQDNKKCTVCKSFQDSLFVRGGGGGGMGGGRHLSWQVKIIYTRWILRVTVIRMESAVKIYFPTLECY